MVVEVAAMDVMRIPAALPPAITVSREVAEFCLAEDLEAYGTTGPAALAWRWALAGQGPTPVSLREWQQGPPDHDTLLDESRWPYGDGWGGRAPQAEIARARFLLWWLTAGPGEAVPARFWRSGSRSAPVAVEDGAVAAALAVGYGQFHGGAFGKGS
jgi:hypothetical protein